MLLSLEAVLGDDRCGVCTRMMEIMAVLSAAGVRRDLLHTAGQRARWPGAGTGWLRNLVDRALARLAERSLLTFSLDGQTVIAHRLVMQVVRDGLARQGR